MWFQIFIADSDGEGWETVQRGGKTKSRNSPSQRSLENLSLSAEKRINRSLTRSKSDPYAPMPKRDNNRSTNRKNALNNRKSTLTPIRDRSARKDSEKENRPMTYSKVANKNGQPVVTSALDVFNTSTDHSGSIPSQLKSHMIEPDTSPDQKSLDAEKLPSAVTCTKAESFMLNGHVEPIDVDDADIYVGFSDSSVLNATADSAFKSDCREDIKTHSMLDVGDILDKAVTDAIEDEALSAKSEQLDDVRLIDSHSCFHYTPTLESILVLPCSPVCPCYLVLFICDIFASFGGQFYRNNCRNLFLIVQNAHASKLKVYLLFAVPGAGQFAAAAGEGARAGSGCSHPGGRVLAQGTCPRGEPTDRSGNRHGK